MISCKEILAIPPYSLDKVEKEKLLTERLKELTEMHCQKCKTYSKMLSGLRSFSSECIRNYYDIPYIPVSLFKEMDLFSVDKSEIFKIITSSGTAGQLVSKVYLDRTTASNQQKTLVKIVTDFTGSSRLPMLIIDSPSVIKNHEMFSARGAGILGFSIFGTDTTYALDDEMCFDLTAVEGFLNRHKGQKILIFGFTFMIWQHLYEELLKLNKKLDLSQGILIHGGGWKKLEADAVSHNEFNRQLFDICGLAHIHDYYGMVEQTGSIYVECEFGHLHSSVFSDIITRRHIDFQPCEINESGIIQIVSVLPESYPGHSLLTEDEGVILGEDDCPCGRKGKYFQIIGRVKNAEIRGCSDTYAVDFG